MVQFKPLIWYKQDELNGFYAEPSGLAYRYSIIVHSYNRIEFAILDNYNYEYVLNTPEICSTIAEAKEKADAHYFKLLQNFLT